MLLQYFSRFEFFQTPVGPGDCSTPNDRLRQFQADGDGRQTVYTPADPDCLICSREEASDSFCAPQTISSGIYGERSGKSQRELLRTMSRNRSRVFDICPVDFIVVGVKYHSDSLPSNGRHGKYGISQYEVFN